MPTAVALCTPIPHRTVESLTRYARSKRTRAFQQNSQFQSVRGRLLFLIFPSPTDINHHMQKITKMVSDQTITQSTSHSHTCRSIICGVDRRKTLNRVINASKRLSECLFVCVHAHLLSVASSYCLSVVCNPDFYNCPPARIGPPWRGKLKMWTEANVPWASLIVPAHMRAMPGTTLHIMPSQTFYLAIYCIPPICIRTIPKILFLTLITIK